MICGGDPARHGKEKIRGTKKTLEKRENGRKYAHMKTTIELDDQKLERIMIAMNLKTRKEAIDWALTEAERLAIIHSIKANPWSARVMEDAIDPDYDVMAMRRAVRMHVEN